MTAAATKRVTGTNRYLFLLVSLGAVFAVQVLIGSGRIQRLALALTAFTMIVATVRAVSDHPVLNRIAYAAGGLALVTNVAHAITAHGALAIAWNGFVATFLGIASYLVLRDVFRTGAVTADTIRGAICAYFMFGTCWAFLFGAVAAADPGAFIAAGAPGRAFDATAEPMMYFSFVTLTTLGYGDILPVSEPARLLAWMEAVLGQLYLAIVVARLVGLHLSQGDARRA